MFTGRDTVEATGGLHSVHYDVDPPPGHTVRTSKLSTLDTRKLKLRATALAYTVRAKLSGMRTDAFFNCFAVCSATNTI